MKIGVLTLPNTMSFGASLQAVALCKTVERFGSNVVLINYQNEKVFNDLKKFNHENFSSIKEIVKYLAVVSDIKKSKKRFQEFESIVCKYPDHVLGTADQLKAYTEDFDAIICGSDQIWNSNITGGDKNFFLQFCGDGILKLSYAPSFGYSSISNHDEKEKVTKLLERFDFLSVREKAAQDIIIDLIGQKAEIVLDPTLLLTKKQWMALSNDIFNFGDYILFYSVGRSDSMKLFASKLSKETGLRVISIGGRMPDKYRKNFKAIRGIGPREWLSLFNDAKYIVTNSFHGTAFSINLNKPFFVELLNNSNINSRLEHILNTFCLNGRCVLNSYDINNINKPINWNKVNTILKREREKSFNYLKIILGGYIE